MLGHQRGDHHFPDQGVLDTSTLAKVIKSRELNRQDLGGYANASQIGPRARQCLALFKRQLVDGRLHIQFLRLPRRSQLVATTSHLLVAP